jgi:hypothetical protein
MKTLHTIMEIRVAIGPETVVAMEFQFRRRRWQQLQRANEQGNDPAWISLATKAQLEAQLTALEKRNPQFYLRSQRSTESGISS